MSNPTTIISAFDAYQELLSVNAQLAQLEKRKKELKPIIDLPFRSNQLLLSHPKRKLQLVRKLHERKGYTVADFSFWTYDLTQQS